MIPHTYSIDSQAKSTELAAKILAAEAPLQISAAVAAVELHLQAHSLDQNRHFFSITFPTLICKIFGFDDSSSSSSAAAQGRAPSPSGWIDTVSASTDSDLAGKLFRLLSPGSVLMAAITAVDRLSLVKYVFPVERMPQWVRFMLSNERDCRIVSDLCPLLKGRLKEDQGKWNCQVQLNVFEYYMFWFAYYPVCRGNNENSSIVSNRRSRKSRLENWTSSFAVFSGGTKRESEHKIECNLYMRLLNSYLCTFVPLTDVDACQPYRSSLLQYSTSYDDASYLRAEFLVNTLVQFWLFDNDPSPLPINLSKSFGVSFPFRSVLGESPPVPGLGQVVKLLMEYLNLSFRIASQQSDKTDYGSTASPAWRKSGPGGHICEIVSVSPSLPHANSWNLVIQRPLYRFILRTFLFCPMGTSMKNLSEVVNLWISYIEPWKLSKEGFGELDEKAGCTIKVTGNDDAQSTSPKYSSIWQGYVLSNYLFYTSLVMHFIGFAHKFLHTDAEMIVQLLAKVMNVLTSSKELLELIKTVHLVFHSKSAGSGKLMLNYMNKFVVPIREQLQDWEDGLCENDADGSFLHENWNKDLRLFSVGEDGGQQLLQLFLLRAESEMQRSSSSANNLQFLDSLKAQLGNLFGADAVKPMPCSPESRPHQQSRDEVFSPRRVGNQFVGDFIKYKGDWMRRPISDDEIAWLAKLLIHFSSWLNESLGLDQGEEHVLGGMNHPTVSYVDVSSDAVCDSELADGLRHILDLVVSGVLALRLAVTRTMIRYGLKVNLRVLASKKFITLLFSFVVFGFLKKAFLSLQ
ncbi:hypothetical protein Dimus_008957 [Dionaea muscipula]